MVATPSPVRICWRAMRKSVQSLKREGIGLAEAGAEEGDQLVEIGLVLQPSGDVPRATAHHPVGVAAFLARIDGDDVGVVAGPRVAP